ncbi:hypothetical protein [Roseateles koreensis]|uniref:Uncharacterized protein n=1 Tax=Roseateles koreensis TaxID=2987526 RepID=A0ABT5KT42_9BURK|nr:hypothetical protein [Roseateles koreensis]MDC8786089.1 hypothetical protein [Roseateles koreensis]
MLLLALQACTPDQVGSNSVSLGTPMKQGAQMKALMNLTVVSYHDREIFDVLINGKYAGLGSGMRSEPLSGYGTQIGVPMTFGPQTITWRLDGPEGMARNGETVVSKNTPIFESIPKGHNTLTVYVYPDDTTELVTSKDTVEDSARGLAIIRERRRAKQ